MQCRDIASPVLLRHLTPLFADADLPVRVNAARAIEQVGSDSAALLLRLRAELGSDEPELLAACIGGTLRLDGAPALPWVAAFLTRSDDLSTEAVAHLRHAHTATRNRDLRATLLAAIASTRLPEATTFLLHLITTHSPEAATAAKALCDASPTPELAEQLRTLGHPCI